MLKAELGVSYTELVLALLWFGWLRNTGRPELVFVGAAGFLLIALGTISLARKCPGDTRARGRENAVRQASVRRNSPTVYGLGSTALRRKRHQI